MQFIKTSPRHGSAYEQIGIRSVNNGLLSLENNSYAAIYETSSVNFELKSDAEQDVLIENYKSFLNGLNFPIQIIIRTREVDLDSIEDQINRQLRNESNKVFRTQLTNYGKFLKSLVDDNRILTRRFYIVIGYEGNSKSDKESVREQISIRADIVVKGLQRLGMNATQLDDLAVLNLFYSFYSPGLSKRRPLSHELLSAMKPRFMEFDYAKI